MATNGPGRGTARRPARDLVFLVSRRTCTLAGQYPAFRPHGEASGHPCSYRGRRRTGAASDTRCPSRRQTSAVRASHPAAIRAPVPASNGRCSGACWLRATGAEPLPRSRAQPRIRPVPSVAASPVRRHSSPRSRAVPPPPVRFGRCGGPGEPYRPCLSVRLHAAIQALQVFGLQAVKAVLADTGHEVHANGDFVAVVRVLADDRLGDVLHPVLKPLLNRPRLARLLRRTRVGSSNCTGDSGAGC